MLKGLVNTVLKVVLSSVIKAEDDINDSRFLLLEDGDFLLLEDEEKIELE